MTLVALNVARNFVPDAEGRLLVSVLMEKLQDELILTVPDAEQFIEETFG